MTSIPLTDVGRHAAYTGRCTSWPAVAVAAIASVALLALGATSDGPTTDFVLVVLVTTIGTVVNVLTAGHVRTTTGRNGVTIRWGLVGWPRCSYPPSQIERAEIANVPWWRVAYGFWWTPHRTSCTVRSGPNLRLHLTNGRIVTVTVPDPSAALNALAQRA